MVNTLMRTIASYFNDIKQGDTTMQHMINKIKKSCLKKKYDCIVGVSGGRDSTYTLLIAKQLGLPIYQIIIACNINDTLCQYIEKGIITKKNVFRLKKK